MRVLVADPGLGQVRAFDQDGVDLGSWFDAGDLPVELQARGLRPSALRAQDDVVWVAHDGDPAVFAADEHGWLGPIVDNADAGVRVEEPCAFADVGDGAWLLANDSRTAVRLDRSGGITGSLAEDVRDPHGIAALDGRLYVVSSLRTREDGVLQVFDADGRGGRPLLDVPLVDPVGVLADPAVPHSLLVADWGADRVVRLDAEGRLLAEILHTPRPVALAVDLDGRLLVLSDDGLLRVRLPRSGLPPGRADVVRLTDPSPFDAPRNLLVLPE